MERGSVSRAEIAFPCPACGAEARAGADGAGRCTGCRRETALDVPGALEDGAVARCPACGSGQLYLQSDFNQRVGLGVVVLGAVLAPFTRYLSLLVATLVDAALYVALPRVTICYRCHAHLRGFRKNPHHEAFDIHVAEQYDVHRSEP